MLSGGAIVPVVLAVDNRCCGCVPTLSDDAWVLVGGGGGCTPVTNDRAIEWVRFALDRTPWVLIAPSGVGWWTIGVMPWTLLTASVCGGWALDRTPGRGWWALDGIECRGGC